MRQKRKRILKQLVALTLAIVLFNSNISILEVLAGKPANHVGSVTQPQGNANPAGASGGETKVGYDFNVKSFADTSQCINSRAYLITIQKIENTARGNARFEAAYRADNTLTQVAFSAADQYLSNYPGCFSTSQITSDGIHNYALVGVKDNNGVTGPSALPSSSVVYASANGNMSSGTFAHCYIKSKSAMGSVNSSWKPTDLTRSTLFGNEELRTKFLDGRLTLSEAKGAISGNMSAAIENVIKPLADSGNLTAAMNGDWTTEMSGDTAMYKFYLLDYLLAINNMCGNAYDSLIAEYLTTLNSDGFGSFVVPMIAVCQIYRVNDSTYACSTLPDMLGMANNGSYVEIPGSVDGSISPAEGGSSNNLDNSTQMRWSQNLMDSIANSKAGRKQVRSYCMNWWAEGYGSNAWRGYKWAFSLCPTDIKGRQSGSIGYTYLALGGNKDIVIKIDETSPDAPIAPPDGDDQDETPHQYEFSVGASSEQSIVGKGTQVAAKVEIDIGTDKWGSLWQEYLKRGDPTLVIATAMVPEAGTGTSSTIIDQVVKPAGGAKTDENHITWNNISWSTLEPYITGKQKITYMDSGITITEKTKNLYAVALVFIFPDGKTTWFYATGKIKYGDPSRVGADRVNWGFENEDIHYYSSIGKSDILDNYVEIKEGAPGSESYEAMAGVPTTENLYVGFGATEFMVNMDGELGTSSGTRFYKYEYKNPQCYGHDVPCVLSCAGGHFSASGGCGKAIAWDSRGNPTKYCESGHYSINDDDCSDGKWQYEWVCSCSGTVLSSGSGKAPMHQGEVCIGIDGSTDDNGGTEYGCKIEHHFNTAHPGATIIYTIQQPIDTFNYLNITAADIWRISELKADLNGSLFVNAKQQKETGTGAWSYINQNGYASGNGRLLFKTTQTSKDKKNASDVTGSNNSSIWGDSYCDHTESAVETWEATAAKALAWAAAIPNGDSVQAMVVSDYIELGTTEGYNHIAYHTYTSNVASLTPGGTFSTPAPYPGDDPGAHSGVAGQTLTAQTLTFPVKTIQDFWYNNTSDCASDWTEYDVTRSGYNGKYNQPGSKWNNNNTKNKSTTKLDTVMKVFQKRFDKNGGADAQPNQKHRATSGFTSDGFGNTRFTFLTNPINNYMEWTGSNIKNWPALQNKRVKNGEWDTGRCYIKAEHFDTLSSTEGGIDYSGYENWTEVGYTQGKPEVNDIVIFNPVSTQFATVITNDSKYDQRSNASLIAGGDPENNVDFCLGDSSCQYQILTCNEPYCEKFDMRTIYHREDSPNVGSYQILVDCTDDRKVVDGMQAAIVRGYVTMLYKSNNSCRISKARFCINIQILFMFSLTLKKD